MKIKKLLACLLVSSLTFSFCACGGGATSSSSSENKNVTVEKNPLLVNLVVCLNEFESQKEFNLLAMENLLGKVEINTDVAYTKSGNGSAKVTVASNVYDYRNTPSLYHAMELQARGEDYTDFTKAGDLTLSVYNANSTTEKLGFQFYYGPGTSSTFWFDLAPSGWTDIRWTIPSDIIPVTTDADGEERRIVKGIHMVFERPAEEDNVFYLDQLRLYPTQKEVNSVVKTLQKDEIASFDNWWQIADLEYSGGLFAPTAEWAKDKIVDADGKALKLIALPGSSTWPHICFNPTYCARVDWGSYSGEDALNMFLYLPKGQKMRIALTLYVGANVLMVEHVDLNPGEWNHLSWTVDYINAVSATKYKGYTFAGLTKITVGYQPFSGSASKTLYVDNIHMTRANGTAQGGE